MCTEEQIINLYKTGIKREELVNITGLSISGLYRLLKKNGVIRKQTEVSSNVKKYSLDETFFDVINTEEKAYYLGLLYADGYNNTKTYGVALTLQAEDVDILKRFLVCLKTDRPLRYVRREEGSTFKDIYTLYIGNKYFSLKLAEQGCGKAKSLVLKFPDESILPRELYPHFIRGYFDGDGGVRTQVAKSKDVNGSFSFIGSVDFITRLNTILEEECKIPLTRICNSKHSKSVTLQYSGRDKCIMLRDYMYTNATVYLERKRIKFFQVTPKRVCLK
jgi:hypothetical protein